MRTYVTLFDAASWTFLIGLLLIAIGIVWEKSLYWTPVQSPFGPTPGIYHSSKFVTDLTGTYDIGLEVERTMPYELINCLVGWSEVRGKVECKNIPTKVDMAWRIFSDNVELAHGHSNDMVDHQGYKMSLGGWVSKDKMYRVIGTFEGHSGRSYVAEVTLFDDIQLLSQASPKLSIRPPSLAREGDSLLAGLIQIIGFLASTVGLVMIGFRVFKRYRVRNA